MRMSKKPQSITTQTRLSHSNIFNNSSLASASIPDFARNKYMSNNIQNSENKQVQYLRMKNAQLQQKNCRMAQHIKELEQNKRDLLQMNRKYVKVVNQYYENENKKKYKSTNNLRKIENSEDLQNSYSYSNLTSTQAHRILQQLEKDHRNLVKHCLVMEEQIKNYSNQMKNYNFMKDQLLSANHSSVQQILEQLFDVTKQSKTLKKQNNHLTYTLQRTKMDYDALRKKNGLKQKQAGDGEAEIAKMRSLMNTIKQQSLDKSSAYQSRIYQLQLKVQKLEKQLRMEQERGTQASNQRKSMQIKQVQYIHEYDKLQKSLNDIFIKQKRQRYFTKAKPSRYLDRSLAINKGVSRSQKKANSISYIATK